MLGFGEKNASCLEELVELHFHCSHSRDHYMLPIQTTHSGEILEIYQTWHTCALFEYIFPVVLRILGFPIAPHLVGNYIIPGTKSLPQ